MTLKEFLAATRDVPEPALRNAMTVALAIEPARTPGQYRRFYNRTMHELGLEQGALDCCEPAWKNGGGAGHENIRGVGGW